MKTTVVSYSLTGNNDALAAGIAAALAADHIKITEPEPRTNSRIAFDMLLNRKPKVDPFPDDIEGSNLVLFVGPIKEREPGPSSRLSSARRREDAGSA